MMVNVAEESSGIAFNDSSSGQCYGGHVWVWGGDIPDWPYDGMPCSCGAVKYDRRQAVKDQIAELQRQLAELDSADYDPFVTSTVTDGLESSEATA